MKILIFSLFLLPFSFLFSQGNLQFNQVLTYSLSGTTSSTAGIYTIQTINVTVPANKVWKIESANCRASYSTVLQSNANIAYITLNNAFIVSNSTSYVMSSFPIWLNEGNHVIQLVVQVGTSVIGNAYGLVTGIEFNIIP